VGHQPSRHDVNPAKRIDENAPQMRCEQKTTERVGGDGQVRTTRT
jgi:hypothetical protein